MVVLHEEVKVHLVSVVADISDHEVFEEYVERDECVRIVCLILSGHTYVSVPASVLGVPRALVKSGAVRVPQDGEIWHTLFLRFDHLNQRVGVAVVEPMVVPPLVRARIRLRHDNIVLF